MSSSTSAIPTIVQTDNSALIFDDLKLNRPQLLTAKSEDETDSVDRAIEECISEAARSSSSTVTSATSNVVMPQISHPLAPRATLAIPTVGRPSSTSMGRVSKDMRKFAKQWKTMSNAQEEPNPSVHSSTSSMAVTMGDLSSVKSTPNLSMTVRSAISENDAHGHRVEEAATVPTRQISRIHYAPKEGRSVPTPLKLSESADMSEVQSEPDGKAIDDRTALGMLTHAPASNGVPNRQISTSHFGVPPGGRTVPGASGGTASSGNSARDGGPSTSERRVRRGGASSSSRRSAPDEWDITVTIRYGNMAVDDVTEASGNKWTPKLTVKNK